MKYLNQFGIITAICCIAELLYIFLKLPVPASVYGLVLMLVLLFTKVIKVEQVEGISKFFLGIMPILFLSPSVSIMAIVGDVKGQVVALLLVAFIASILTILSTGAVAQWSVQLLNKGKRKEESAS